MNMRYLFIYNQQYLISSASKTETLEMPFKHILLEKKKGTTFPKMRASDTDGKPWSGPQGSLRHTEGPRRIQGIFHQLQVFLSSHWTD